MSAEVAVGDISQVISQHLNISSNNKKAPSPTNVMEDWADSNAQQQAKKPAARRRVPSKRHSACVVPQTPNGKKSSNTSNRTPRQSKGHERLQQSFTAEGFESFGKARLQKSQPNFGSADENDSDAEGDGFTVLRAQGRTKRPSLGSLFTKTGGPGPKSTDAKSCVAEFYHDPEEESLEEKLRRERKEMANQLAKQKSQSAIEETVASASLSTSAFGPSSNNKKVDSISASISQVKGEELGYVIGPVVNSYINNRAVEDTIDDDDLDDDIDSDEGDDDIISTIHDNNQDIDIDTDDEEDILRHNKATEDGDVIQHALRVGDETARRQAVAEAVLGKSNPLVKMFDNLNGPSAGIPPGHSRYQQTLGRLNSKSAGPSPVNKSTSISNLVASLSQHSHAESRPDPVAHADELRRQRKAKANELAKMHKKDTLMDNLVNSAEGVDRRTAVIAALLSESGQGQKPLSGDLRGMLQAKLMGKAGQPKNDAKAIGGSTDGLSNLAQKVASSRNLMAAISSKTKLSRSNRSISSGSATGESQQESESLEQTTRPKVTTQPRNFGTNSHDLPSHLKKPSKTSMRSISVGSQPLQTRDPHVAAPSVSKSKVAKGQRPLRSRSTTAEQGIDTMDKSLKLDDMRNMSSPLSAPNSARQRLSASRRATMSRVVRKSMPNVHGDLDSSSDLKKESDDFSEPPRRSKTPQGRMSQAMMKSMPNVAKPVKTNDSLDDSLEIEQLHRSPRRSTGAKRHPMRNLAGKSMPNLMKMACDSDDEDETQPHKRTSSTAKKPLRPSKSFDASSFEASLDLEEIVSGPQNPFAAIKLSVKRQNSLPVVAAETSFVPKSKTSGQQMTGWDSLSDLKIADVAPTSETNASAKEKGRQQAFHQSFAAGDLNVLFPAKKNRASPKSNEVIDRQQSGQSRMQDSMPTLQAFGDFGTFGNESSEHPKPGAASAFLTIVDDNCAPNHDAGTKSIDSDGETGVAPGTGPGALHSFLTITDDNARNSDGADDDGATKVSSISHSLVPSKKDATTQKRTRSKSVIATPKMPQTPLTEMKRSRRRVSISASSVGIPSLTGHSSQAQSVHDAEMDGSRKFGARRQISDVSGSNAHRLRASDSVPDSTRTPGRVRKPKVAAKFDSSDINLDVLRTPGRRKGAISLSQQGNSCSVGTSDINLDLLRTPGRRKSAISLNQQRNIDSVDPSATQPSIAPQAKRRSLSGTRRGYMSERNLQVPKTSGRKSLHGSVAGTLIPSRRSQKPLRHKSHDIPGLKRKDSKSELGASTKVSARGLQPRRHASHDGAEAMPTSKSRLRRNKTGEGIVEESAPRPRKSTSQTRRQHSAGPRRRQNSRRRITALHGNESARAEETAVAEVEVSTQKSEECENVNDDAAKSQPKAKLRSLIKSVSAMNLMSALKTDESPDSEEAQSAAKGDARDEQMERLRASLMRGKTDTETTADVESERNPQQLQPSRPSRGMGRATSLRNLMGL